MVNPRPKLRIITYMCPSHPVELYELIMQYLEEEIGCESSLLYESSGPGPLSDRVDPFTDNSVDMGELVTLQISNPLSTMIAPLLFYTQLDNVIALIKMTILPHIVAFQD